MNRWSSCAIAAQRRANGEGLLLELVKFALVCVHGPDHALPTV